MKKTGLAIIIFIGMTILTLIILTQISSDKSDNIQKSADINTISAADSFQQDDDHYFVYFWQEGCVYCEQIEDEMVDYANNGEIPIYLVDMLENENQSAWYDWEAHHQQYDQVIGEVIDGEEQLYQDTESLDSEVNWSITTDDNDQIIAVHQTPYPNLEPLQADQLEITGTPTLIYFEDQTVSAYAIGDEEVTAILNQFPQN
ncbi:hypothetical protein [Amphibacillus cookii]|uniref:hypothetical protein n=1 Tax=Amphibacillus cookii TaxID=767787 RepID=UPI00195800A7|nr:hypothetical protein [Amphibacillus cookii]MBM7540963.1 thioredoxin-related protein [Amphibacillus cookii]